MIRDGKILSIDKATNSGVLLDLRSRRKFQFSSIECQGEVLPAIDTRVTFIIDTDQPVQNVACVITEVNETIQVA